MNDRFLFNAVVSSYYDIDTPENYEEFEPQIYLENVDLFSDEIGIDYDRLLDAVQKQLNLEKPEISQVMQHFEDNSNSNSDEYVTIKPDRVLQCTGLKDKNGKLIYEGDILQSEEYPFKNEKGYNYAAEVLWDDASATFYYYTFRISNNVAGRSTGNTGELNEYEDWKVIGNIYENKELWESEG